ncbi:MAG TPA: cupredoxin family copper-binding protein, partial [Acidobacteriota bacterium]|nr:cupredoxin family copper-binding protein [Acidobacteriota bacterium]
MRKSALYLCVTLLVTISAPGRPAVKTPDPEPVKIDNFNFSPATLTVQVGATVTWINQDDVPHNVVEVDKKFKSGILDTGDRFTYTFKTAGAYDYFCSIHPHMTGKVI